MDDTTTMFRMYYAEKATTCIAVMRDTWFEVIFNRRPVAILVMNGEMEWMLAGGTILPDEIVDEIGYRIESRYM